MTANPNPLTKDDLNRFRQRLVAGEIAQTYDELAAHGYRYAALANGVVKGDTFSGRIALEYLEKTAEVQDRPLSEADVNAIRLSLAHVYLDTLSLQLSAAAALVTRDILADEAWHFHSAVFQNLGLDADAWTLNQPFTHMEAEVRQAYWTYAIGSAGDFTKEVLLGMATDVIMKQAALDLLDPLEAENAWSWLHRLHSLDTYLTTAEFADSKLDQLAASLLTAIAGEMKNGLSALTIKPILDFVDQASLDAALKALLSDLESRIVDSRRLATHRILADAPAKGKP